MHHKARRFNDDSLKSRYKRLRAYVQETRGAYWRYVSNIFIPSEADTNIEKKVNRKVQEEPQAEVATNP